MSISTNETVNPLYSLNEGNYQDDWDVVYNEYKRLFYESDSDLKNILRDLNVSYNSPLHKYILKKSKGDGLNGNERRAKLTTKLYAEGNFKKKDSSLKEVLEPSSEKWSPDLIKMFEDSWFLMNRLFVERNISRSTQKGYISSIMKWFQYVQGKYSDLDDCITSYTGEEDDKIPMRERNIKKDLIGFREFLVNNCGSANSVKTYYAKVRTIFRHYGLEMPDLPNMKLDKEYISSFNDLPTHEMIRAACEQSEILIKSIILFMSSSGTAKAETLSITVRMFLEGCRDYYDYDLNEDTVRDIINECKNRHDIVPLIYLHRLKTDKYYYTCCSPEASYIIFQLLGKRKEVNLDDDLFPTTDSYVLSNFARINDSNDWGRIGKYRRFRTHALRKFMASNIGLGRDVVDGLQGRSKDSVGEAYFKTNPVELKKTYMNQMHRVMVFNNWGYGTTPSDLNRPQVSSVKCSDVVDLTPLIKIEEDNVKELPAVNSLGIANELYVYSELMDKGLISMSEFNVIKTKLLGGLLR